MEQVCMPLEELLNESLTAAILELLDVDRSHQGLGQWKKRLADSVRDPPSAQPTRVEVDETTVKTDDE